MGERIRSAGILIDVFRHQVRKCRAACRRPGVRNPASVVRIAVTGHGPVASLSRHRLRACAATASSAGRETPNNGRAGDRVAERQSGRRLGEPDGIVAEARAAEVLHHHDACGVRIVIKTGVRACAQFSQPPENVNKCWNSFQTTQQQCHLVRVSRHSFRVPQRETTAVRAYRFDFVLWPGGHARPVASALRERKL